MAKRTPGSGQLALPGLWRWQRPCKMDGCPRPLRARGYCNAHYMQWRLHGNPVATPNPHIAKLAARNRSIRQGHFPYEDREWMRSRYEAGLTFHDLAAEAGCGVRTIARWFHIHGLEPRPNGYVRSDRRRPRNPPRCACGDEKAYNAEVCRACYDKRLVGDGNPNWRGLGEVMPLLRQYAREMWRPAIFKRDGYRCRRCGDARGGNLHAHHVVALSAIVRAKRDAWQPDVETTAGRMAFLARLRDDPEVMDLSNGLTLCNDCHRDMHRGSGTYVSLPVRRRRVRRSNGGVRPQVLRVPGDVPAVD